MFQADINRRAIDRPQWVPLTRAHRNRNQSVRREAEWEGEDHQCHSCGGKWSGLGRAEDRGSEKAERCRHHNGTRTAKYQHDDRDRGTADSTEKVRSVKLVARPLPRNKRSPIASPEQKNGAATNPAQICQPYGCTLKAYRKEVLGGMRLYGEMHRFVPIYASWMGAKVVELPVPMVDRIPPASLSEGAAWQLPRQRYDRASTLCLNSSTLSEDRAKNQVFNAARLGSEPLFKGDYITIATSEWDKAVRRGGLALPNQCRAHLKCYRKTFLFRAFAPLVFCRNKKSF